MPWTGLCFLVGAMAISGLPPLNGFASEWLTFQAFLFGFRQSAEPPLLFLFPLAGALLALTTALAAACFVKAFGISFLALPRSSESAAARESSAVMLAPQMLLAALCLALGIVPGAALQLIGRSTASLSGLLAPADIAPSVLGMSSGSAATGSFDHVVPVMLGAVLVAGFIVGWAARGPRTVRTAPTWGCGGELTARTEYTATAFSKPLMMIFGGVYRPTRQVESVAKVSPYFPDEVRYHAEIEPTFERYVYGPLARGIVRIANGMKVLQAGSLNAYLAYAIALVVSLVLFVWWRS
jgi:hydrogenase-4 component B